MIALFAIFTPLFFAFTLLIKLKVSAFSLVLTVFAKRKKLSKLWSGQQRVSKTEAC